jgi:SAM-dependent methyltransferase
LNPGEHELMAQVEEGHWWYLGLRDAIARVLRRPDLAPPLGPRVLDAGCGTGGNLRLLRDLLRPAYLGGFDASQEALDHAARKAPEADLYRSDLCDPVLREPELDLITSFDVVYIPGRERAMDGLRRLVAGLRRNGLVILNLPAYDWLYSEHDVAIHTRERYTRKRVVALLEDLGLRVELVSYRVFFLFPLVVASRLPSLWKARRMEPRDARSDLHRVPGTWVNRLLFTSLRLENRLIGAGVRFPFGSSVFAVARKTGPG